ncbi:hypothetical protein RI129_003527 [Pyrocoelia pectoralis]|uniref:Uncharacterized protein n=1 Tax=Pyrocoelia pectoralis TaxID=417401 RepID=A0AAN7ZIQ2_9COLE
MWNKILLQLCVCACLIVTGNSQSCNEAGQTFLYNTINWYCENITSAFPVSKPYVNSFTCMYCNIAVIDENTITNFRGPIFNLSNSRVKKIAENAFKTFTNSTRKFILNDNDIGYVAPKVFSNFSVSDEINLRNNKISTLKIKSFEGTNVSTLDLSHNVLTDISSVFSGLRVTTLNLSSNGIKEIRESSFDGVTFWTGGQWKYGTQKLDLSKNGLNTIVPNSFKSPNKDNVIRMLYLQRNALTVIENDTFLQLNYLWQLSLEGNRISQLYMDSFKGLTILNNLNLANNLLTDLPNGMFGHLKSLVVLDLSQNLLTTLSPSSFTGLMALTTLNISHNSLETIEDTHLTLLGKLSILDISNTKLHDLKLETIMEHHHLLRTLVLNDNFWTCSKLVQIYKVMNRRGSGFSYPSRYFDVPNLHGIACSRQELDSYDNLTFEDFLEFISKDRVFEDIFDYRLQGNESESSLNSEIAYDIHNIKGMFVIITIIGAILLIHCIIKYTVSYLVNRNIIKNNKFRFIFGTQ